MTGEADRFYMGLALELAGRAAGRTSPNPPVGCVVVRDGRVVGRGFHPRAGEPHAEVFALDEAGGLAEGATLYVTLEPCSHFGRTPPCADRVIRAGVGRVVIAMEDPNPRVAGRGTRALEAAGIETVTGVRRDEAARLLEAYALSILERRAFVHLKLAATLDGKVATSTGDSKWISSPESRERVHRLRDRVGAILVGVGTATSDNPRLTVRLPGEPERRVLRVVLDPGLRAPAYLDLFAPAEAAYTLVACWEGPPSDRAAALRAAGVELLALPRNGAGLDLRTLLSTLYARGIMEVLVEGGSETARRFVDAGLVDRVHLFLAPLLLGGRDSVPLLGGKGPERITDAVRLSVLEWERVGPDFYVTARCGGG